MKKFAVNLSMIFTEVPFFDRFALARKAGFSFVEWLFPYKYKASDLQWQLEANNLQAILFDLPAGDWDNGERGYAVDPNRTDEFREGVHQAVEYAHALGVTQLNCVAGTEVKGYSDAQHWDTLVENVHYAAKVMQKEGLNLLVEPLNRFDVPNFFLYRTEQAISLIEEVGLSNVLLQYDVYHAQREEGELVNNLRKYIHKIGHIQIADNPGRHQPGTGEINYPFIFNEINSLGYKGYIGLEYKPSQDSLSSFSWITNFGYKCMQ